MHDPKEVQALFDSVDWDRAFVKYTRFESPASVCGHGVDAWNCPGNLEISLETLDPKHPLVLLRCFGVHEFRLSFCYDLDPKIESSRERIQLQLLAIGEKAVEADGIEAYLLDRVRLVSGAGDL